MSVSSISLSALSIGFIPVVAVVALLFAWRERSEAKTAAYGVARMLLQLLAVGYVLNFVFATDSSLVVAGVLFVMLAAASWIALRTIAERREKLLLPAMLAIGVTSMALLALVTQGVLQVDSWYDPRVLLPLGGMVLSACMNAVSLAADRVESELAAGTDSQTARHKALKTALIPVTNSMFAVGLVSLPGMMTGQILAGVSPLVAARYQIVVMCMLFGASGLAGAAYLIQHGRLTEEPGC